MIRQTGSSARNKSSPAGPSFTYTIQDVCTMTNSADNVTGAGSKAAQNLRSVRILHTSRGNGDHRSDGSEWLYFSRTQTEIRPARATDRLPGQDDGMDTAQRKQNLKYAAERPRGKSENTNR